MNRIYNIMYRIRAKIARNKLRKAAFRALADSRMLSVEEFGCLHQAITPKGKREQKRINKIIRERKKKF